MIWTSVVRSIWVNMVGTPFTSLQIGAVSVSVGIMAMRVPFWTAQITGPSEWVAFELEVMVAAVRKVELSVVRLERLGGGWERRGRGEGGEGRQLLFKYRPMARPTSDREKRGWRQQLQLTIVLTVSNSSGSLDPENQKAEHRQRVAS